MIPGNEGSETRAVPDGRVHHCCQKEGRVGVNVLEPIPGSFQDRPKAGKERPPTFSSNNCCHQDGGDGFCRSVATVAGQKAETKNQEEMMDILDEAKKVCEERGEDYGHPFNDFSRVAKLWDVLFESNATMTGHACIKPEQVAIAMILLKTVRICQSPNFDHKDSRLDLIGYALCLDEVIQEREAITDTHLPSEPDFLF